MATDGETWEPMLTSSAMRRKKPDRRNANGKEQQRVWKPQIATKGPQVDRQKREYECRAFVTRAGREDPNLELASTKYPVGAVEQDIRLVERQKPMR